jgi:predicted metal-binding protein
MESSNKNLKAHLFICSSCTYKKADQSDSLPGEAELLRKRIKSYVKENIPAGMAQVTGVRCLSECDHGIATVLYPSNEWNLCVKPDDYENLVQKIKALVEN